MKKNLTIASLLLSVKTILIIKVGHKVMKVMKNFALP